VHAQQKSVPRLQFAASTMQLSNLLCAVRMHDCPLLAA
jgi:hypothetical protein